MLEFPIHLETEKQFNEIAQSIPYQTIQYKDVAITIKRLDQIHPAISGNKFFKLKYNFSQAKNLGYKGVLTFGGAFSNHIAATAFAAQLFGFKSLGIIRGEELQSHPYNATLTFAHEYGMQFSFISREQYRQKNQVDFIEQLKTNYPDYYLIPEGGTNDLAILGCQEILSPSDLQDYQTICCAVGTGGTISGIIESCQPHHQVLGFSALKGDFLTREVQQFTSKKNWKIIDDYCCGGYAKVTAELINFIRSFEQKYQIPLEQIYTGKLLMGIFDLVDQGKFPSKVLVIHSGGLQGRSSII
ncbi:1-aminocyclopropane-1-carboxylate deaminase/D-cysteine desulfhydrase [Acinetobacter equi]|uniref:1-aminocyclopropane-1-carboxylate deaminase/D-cysteine desulfhydrase n=1 Tax=Acinetobacter equi TaxID=1324350 RepID=UPI000AA552C9|nr:pyridoxal-phosphate dependent enzyme [Acinetobacter equi]